MERTKKTVAGWAIAALCVCLLVPAVARAQQPPLKVRGDNNYPPFEYEVDGAPVGYTIDVFRAVARTMGLAADIRLGPWSEVRADLEAGRIDLLTGMFRSPEREKLVSFSTPHLQVHHSIFVRKSSPIDRIEELRGKTVLVQRGDIMHDYLTGLGLAGRVVPVENQVEALRLLSSGQHDAALLARIAALYDAKVYGLTNVVAVGPAILPRDYCFAVPKDRQALLGPVNEGLRIIAATGELDRIRDRWFGVYEPRRDWREMAFALAWIVGPLLGLLALLGLWSWSLRRQVARHTRDLRHELEERKRTEAEQARLREQLAQAQKMESVGRLAGGVAHDFNNMLGAILGHAELAMAGVNPTDPLHADLQEIHRAAERSAEVTRQLLAFARKQTAAPRILDLNQAVEGMLKMLRRLIGEDIELTWLPGADLGPVKMDPSQIDQILANLCVNARDAIAGVGRITIETANAVLDDDDCEMHAGCVPGEYASLTVSDNGRGMDQATQAKIFEPFFTTKKLGEGTGLGLATVYGIVRQNQGFINVYSEPGRGSSFKIYLPRREAEAAPQATEAAPAAPVARGSETILLVEDDPTILQMTTRMLARQGYHVLAAASPAASLRLAESHAGAIDLLITDVVMPEMNGRELAANVQALRATTKVLFMSGYTANVIAQHGVLEPGVHFIQKPFSLRTLAAKVREALDAA